MFVSSCPADLVTGAVCSPALMIMILGTWPNTLESWCIPDLCQGVWVEVWGKNGKVGYKQENPGVGKAPGLDEFQNFVGCWSYLRIWL